MTQHTSATTVGPAAAGFHAGGGAMGAQIRAHDWAATPLGPAEHWPQSLRTAVSILINSRHPMFIAWGPDLVFLYNDGYRPIFGDKHPAALGRPFAEIWAEIWTDIEPLVEAALAGHATWSEDLRLFMERSGFIEEVYFTFSYSPIRDESGGVGGMFCACTETTGRVLAERRLRCLRDLAEAAGKGRTVADAERICFDTLSRYPADIPFALLYALQPEGEARLAASHLPPGLAADAAARDGIAGAWPLAAAAAGETVLVDSLAAPLDTAAVSPWGDPGRYALLLPIANRGRGSIDTVLVLGLSPRLAADDAYRTFLTLVARGLETAAENARGLEQERSSIEALAQMRRAATAALEESEARFRHMADNAPVMVWMTDENGSCTYLSRSWYQFTGQDPAAALGFGWLEATHPEDRAATRRSFAAAHASHAAFRLEYRLRRADGRYRWALDAAAPRFGEDGAFLGYIGSVIDITERKQAEEALRTSEARFRTMADNLPLIVWLHDAEGRQEFVNQTFCDYFGVTRTQLRDHQWQILMHPEDAPAYLEEFRASLRERRRFHAEVRVRRGDGAWRWLESWGQPRFGADGSYAGIVGTSADATERKQAEQHRELLVGELNHRVKNTLAVVQGLAQQTFRGAANPVGLVEIFRDRLAALAVAHNLLTQSNWTQADLEDLILQTAEATCGERGRVTVSGPRLSLEPKTAVTVAMALHELCTNALKYGALSAEDGRVQVSWSSPADTADARFRLVWRERGGPPVAPPRRKGFGTRVIEQALAQELDGAVSMEFRPDGLVCTVEGCLRPIALPLH